MSSPSCDVATMASSVAMSASIRAAVNNHSQRCSHTLTGSIVRNSGEPAKAHFSDEDIVASRVRAWSGRTATARCFAHSCGPSDVINARREVASVDQAIDAPSIAS